jgi:nicotinate-nucleotide adenylyltransferase
MSRVGVFGGTFDPIHFGHLITAQSVKELRNLDKIIFVPSYIAPHKQEIKSSLSKYRINMIKLSVEGIPYFDWTDYEIKKKGVSYTIDTLKELKKFYDEIELIVGEDNICTFDKWKSPDEIFKIATIIVLKRKLDRDARCDNKYVRQAIFVETPRIDISGTEIRERVKKGIPINFLVPQKVLKYIYETNLYKV